MKFNKFGQYYFSNGLHSSQARKRPEADQSSPSPYQSHRTPQSQAPPYHQIQVSPLPIPRPNQMPQTHPVQSEVCNQNLWTRLLWSKNKNLKELSLFYCEPNIKVTQLWSLTLPHPSLTQTIKAQVVGHRTRTHQGNTDPLGIEQSFLAPNDLSCKYSNRICLGILTGVAEFELLVYSLQIQHSLYSSELGHTQIGIRIWTQSLLSNLNRRRSLWISFSPLN